VTTNQLSTYQYPFLYPVIQICIRYLQNTMISVGMKTVSEFFGIPETVFDFFRSEASVSVFLGIGIGHRNLTSESVSKSVQPFTDRILRLPFWIGIYRIQNSEFTEIHGPAQILKCKNLNSELMAHGRPMEQGSKQPSRRRRSLPVFHFRRSQSLSQNRTSRRRHTASSQAPAATAHRRSPVASAPWRAPKSRDGLTA
jgi:hypothetical protein